MQRTVANEMQGDDQVTKCRGLVLWELDRGTVWLIHTLGYLFMTSVSQALG